MTRGAEDGNPCREENRGRNLFIQIFVDFILLLAGNYIYSFILILYLILICLRNYLYAFNLYIHHVMHLLKQSEFGQSFSK